MVMENDHILSDRREIASGKAGAEVTYATSTPAQRSYFCA